MVVVVVNTSKLLNLVQVVVNTYKLLNLVHLMRRTKCGYFMVCRLLLCRAHLLRRDSS